MGRFASCKVVFGLIDDDIIILVDGVFRDVATVVADPLKVREDFDEVNIDVSRTDSLIHAKRVPFPGFFL